MNEPLDRQLIALADPERATVEVAPETAPLLVEQALSHGVLPIILRKIGHRLPEATHTELQRQASDRVGLMLHLRTIGAKVSALSAGGLQAAVVKGPDLADHAYPVRGDRTFTDLDILAAPEANADLAQMLQALGYRMHVKSHLDHTVSNEEQKWIHPGIPSVLVEVHGNLVHYAALRSRVGFGYRELMQCHSHSPALARFFTCIVHATLGHKLHELRLLVDILQTFRQLDDDDLEALPALARQLTIKLETARCLQLVGQLFAVQPASALARPLAGEPGLFERLVDGQSVLDFPRRKFAVARHHLFRAYQYMVPRR